MFSASEISPLNNRIRAATAVIVSPTIGVPVCGEIRPSHFGASPSSASMIATREGTIIVPLRDVVIAISAPIVMITSAPRGR